MDAHKEIDTRGLNCPLPILKAKKALSELQAGDVLIIGPAADGVLEFSKLCGHGGMVALRTNAREANLGNILVWSPESTLTCAHASLLTLRSWLGSPR